jgi:hypothetical protein
MEKQNNRDQTIEVVEVMQSSMIQIMQFSGVTILVQIPIHLRPGQSAPFKISLWPGVTTDIPINEIASTKMHRLAAILPN